MEDDDETLNDNNMIDMAMESKNNADITLNDTGYMVDEIYREDDNKVRMEEAN